MDIIELKIKYDMTDSEARAFTLWLGGKDVPETLEPHLKDAILKSYG